MLLYYKKWLLRQGLQGEKDSLKLRQWNNGLESCHMSLYVTVTCTGQVIYLSLLFALLVQLLIF